MFFRFSLSFSYSPTPFYTLYDGLLLNIKNRFQTNSINNIHGSRTEKEALALFIFLLQLLLFSLGFSFYIHLYHYTHSLSLRFRCWKGWNNLWLFVFVCVCVPISDWAMEDGRWGEICSRRRTVKCCICKFEQLVQYLITSNRMMMVIKMMTNTKLHCNLNVH